MNPEIQKRLGAKFSTLEASEQQYTLKLLTKFISLGFDASFAYIENGPIVDTYFFEPSPISPLSKIFGREEDLALTLGVESIILQRELQYISIAVPRRERKITKFEDSLYSLFKSPAIKEMTLPLSMGINPKGEEFYVDLAVQPHLLIGGATGSGKSIFISQLICGLSLIYSKDELEFILADTKQLDLIPFASMGLVKSIDKDIHSLRTTLEKLLEEVRSRNSMMSGIVRNIKEWNSLNSLNPLKYKILIIDEFADVVDMDRGYLRTLKPSFRPAAIEELVKTLTQIARAAGIHVIIATQRPSVKVLAGDLKANFSARIAFKLSSMQDSRVILDENGAERLLGRGDYLYKTATTDSVKRAHSTYVSMNTIASIISHADIIRMQFAQSSS